MGWPITFSVLVPSVGRPSLASTLKSIASQLIHGDELLVDVNADGGYGAAARNRLTRKATGNFVLYMDDDDIYLPGAFEVIRYALVDGSDVIHIFRMEYHNEILWKRPVLQVNNVSTQMFVLPNEDLPLWTDKRRDHDFTFINECARRWPITWHDEVIARYKAEV